MLANILLKNSSTIFLSLPLFLRISFNLCSGIRMLPLALSIRLLILPLIRFEKNDFNVFSMSSQSFSKSQSNLCTAIVKPSDPHCIRSFIVNTPEACCDVENLRAMFSTSGINFIISSSFVYSSQNLPSRRPIHFFKSSLYLM